MAKTGSAQNYANTASAQLGGRRFQPTALDVARDAERYEREARFEALRLAAYTGEAPELSVNRAAAYYAFLTGE